VMSSTNMLSNTVSLVSQCRSLSIPVVHLPISIHISHSVMSSGSSPIKLDPRQTAVVLIEFQNEFLKPGGTLHDGVKAVMSSTNMLSNTVSLVSQCRSLSIPVVHLPISFSSSYSELHSSPYGILQGIVSSKSFQKGSWGSAIVDELQPAAGELVIEGKRGLCGFASTNLEFVLRQKDVKNVVLAGLLSNVCIESTMRTAYEKGFQVYTLTDCVATTSEEAQQAAINNYALFSRPVTSKEFVALF